MIFNRAVGERKIIVGRWNFCIHENANTEMKSPWVMGWEEGEIELSDRNLTEMRLDQRGYHIKIAIVFIGR